MFQPHQALKSQSCFVFRAKQR